MTKNKNTFSKVAHTATQQVKQVRKSLGETIRDYTVIDVTPEKIETIGKLFDMPANIVSFSSCYNTKEIRARLFETAPYILAYTDGKRTFARRAWAWYRDTPNTWAKCYTLKEKNDFADVIEMCAKRVYTNTKRTNKPLAQFVGKYGVYYTEEGTALTCDIYSKDKDGNHKKIN